jgi:cytidine deaminase
MITLNNSHIFHDMINFREKEIINHKGHYNHVAMIFLKNNPTNPLSYGTNYLINNHNNITIHAEHDALMRLKENKKKQKKINIVVIRYNSFFELCNSKPCSFCLNHMNNIATYKGYIINKVYYSINNNIKCIKFNELFYDKEKHIPKRYRTKLSC